MRERWCPGRVTGPSGIRTGADTVIAIAAGPSEMESVEIKDPVAAVTKLRYEIQGNEIGCGDRTNFLLFGPDAEQIRIEPRIVVHGTTQIDPGLIRVNAAYGYMHAFDAMVEARDGGTTIDGLQLYHDSTESIVEQRREV